MSKSKKPLKITLKCFGCSGKGNSTQKLVGTATITGSNLPKSECDAMCQMMTKWVDNERIGSENASGIAENNVGWSSGSSSGP